MYTLKLKDNHVSLYLFGLALREKAEPSPQCSPAQLVCPLLHLALLAPVITSKMMY